MIYIFDIDGTLTPPRKKMTNEMLDFMMSWGAKNSFYLCSGSDEEKIKEQIPEPLLRLCNGLFTCMGNQFIKNGIEVYRREFNAPNGLEDKLNEFLLNSKFPDRYGNHIEKRLGMWNFSTVGRNVDFSGRKDYVKFERHTPEREQYADILNETFKGQIVASVGGEISIDIVNPGSDKSQVLSEIEKIEGEESSLIFIGDKTFPGGNDYALARLVNDRKDSFTFQTESWQITKKYLNFSNKLN
jgi:phosphomannomutase